MNNKKKTGFNFTYILILLLLATLIVFSFTNLSPKLAKKDINLAFVPFDPKLGMYQSLGMEYFLENTNAEYVFPMHMWQDYSGIQPFIKRLSNKAMADRIVPIVHENQVFEIQEE